MLKKVAFFMLLSHMLLLPSFSSLMAAPEKSILQELDQLLNNDKTAQPQFDKTSPFFDYGEKPEFESKLIARQEGADAEDQKKQIEELMAMVATVKGDVNGAQVADGAVNSNVKGFQTDGIQKPYVPGSAFAGAEGLNTTGNLNQAQGVSVPTAPMMISNPAAAVAAVKVNTDSSFSTVNTSPGYSTKDLNIPLPTAAIAKPIDTRAISAPAGKFKSLKSIRGVTDSVRAARNAKEAIESVREMEEAKAEQARVQEERERQLSRGQAE